MNISLILFLIGILGFILNRKNIILMIIAIEIMLLSVTLLVLIMSYGFDDNIGQTFSIYIISIAGAESVIGLSILVAYYRLFTPIISNCLFNNNTLHFVAPSTSLEGGKLQIKCNNISFYKQTRNYSTYLSPPDLLSRDKGKFLYSDPLFITGLFDAEGSFVIRIINNPKLVKGCQARIQIKMHENDRALIQSIQEFFGWIGYVSKPNNYSMVEFRVSTVKDLVDVIIPHFDNYPLNTKKYLDYLLFKKIVFKLLNKEHNTYEGLQDIVNIRSSLNLGLSNELKKAFPGTVPAIRPEFLLKNISGP
jgi:NADH:ubiquinone oxidoreductase subunit K